MTTAAFKDDDVWAWTGGPDDQGGGFWLLATIIILIIIVCLAGCRPACPASSLPAMPDQDEAEHIVWRELYGRADLPPAVGWSFDHCPLSPGDPRTAVVAPGACYSGLTVDPCLSLVAWRGAFSTSAYAHELMHSAQDLDGHPDPTHKLRPADWRLADATAPARLADAGL